MTPLDVIYVALLTAAFLLDGFVLWPSFLRRSQDEPSRARLWIWSCWMSLLWTLVAAGAAIWLLKGRAWGALGLVVISGWQLWGALALFLVLAVMFGRTFPKLARATDSQRESMRSQFKELAVMLPRTRSELCWFMALSLTAGFCEEFIFRGYLIWVFGPALGWWGAAAISVVAFGLAHAYQGMSGIVKTGAIGAMMTIVVLVFGSLWPAMAIHALIDVGSGITAWLVFREGAASKNIVDGLGEST